MTGNIKQRVGQFLQLTSSKEVDIPKEQKKELKKIGHDKRYIDAIHEKLESKKPFATSTKKLDLLKELIDGTIRGGSGGDRDTVFPNIKRNPDKAGTLEEFEIEISGKMAFRSRDEIELHILLNSNLNSIAVKKNVGFDDPYATVGGNHVGYGKIPPRRGPSPIDQNNARPQLRDWPFPCPTTASDVQATSSPAPAPTGIATAGTQQAAPQRPHKTAQLQPRQKLMQSASYSNELMELDAVAQLWPISHVEKTVSRGEGNAWLRSSWLSALGQLTPDQLRNTLTKKLKGRQAETDIDVVVKLATTLCTAPANGDSQHDFDQAFQNADESLKKLTLQIIHRKMEVDYKKAFAKLAPGESSAAKRTQLGAMFNQKQEKLFDAITNPAKRGDPTHVVSLLGELGADVVVAEKHDNSLTRIHVISQSASELSNLRTGLGKSVDAFALTCALRCKPIIVVNGAQCIVQMPRRPEAARRSPHLQTTEPQIPQPDPRFSVPNRNTSQPPMRRESVRFENVANAGHSTNGVESHAITGPGEPRATKVDSQYAPAAAPAPAATAAKTQQPPAGVPRPARPAPAGPTRRTSDSVSEADLKRMEEYQVGIYPETEIDIRLFIEALSEAHHKYEVSGAANNCWLRVLWASIFRQCNPDELSDRLTTLLRERCNLSEVSLLQNARAESSIEKSLDDGRSPEVLANQLSQREQLAVRNLSDDITQVKAMAKDFKTQAGHSKFRLNGAFGALDSKSETSPEEDALKNVTYSLLRPHMDKVEANLTSSILGKKKGDSVEIDFVMKLLGYETFLLRTGKSEDQPHFYTFTHPDITTMPDLGGLAKGEKEEILCEPLTFQPVMTIRGAHYEVFLPFQTDIG